MASAAEGEQNRRLDSSPIFFHEIELNSSLFEYLAANRDVVHVTIKTSDGRPGWHYPVREAGKLPVESLRLTFWLAPNGGEVEFPKLEGKILKISIDDPVRPETRPDEELLMEHAVSLHPHGRHAALALALISSLAKDGNRLEDADIRTGDKVELRLQVVKTPGRANSSEETSG